MTTLTCGFLAITWLPGWCTHLNTGTGSLDAARASLEEAAAMATQGNHMMLQLRAGEVLSPIRLLFFSEGGEVIMLHTYGPLSLPKTGIESFF